MNSLISLKQLSKTVLPISHTTAKFGVTQQFGIK